MELENGQNVVYDERNRDGLSESKWAAELKQEVVDLYEPRRPGEGENHGHCAEMMALSQFLGAGYSFDDIAKLKNFATQVEGLGSKNYGKAWAACKSCERVLGQFDFTDVGGNVKAAKIKREDLS